MKLDENKKYQVLAVNVKKEGIMIAVAPDESRAYPNDLVELSNGKTGIVVFEDSYVYPKEIPTIESAYGEELLKVVGIYRKSKCKWEDEDGKTV